MENNNKNKNAIEQQNDLFWNALETPFTESKEEIWSQLESKIDFENTKVNTINFKWYKVSAAAIFILFFSTTFFARFYSESISTAYGETKTHLLSDGSLVHLNVNSKVNYNPYWFSFNRTLNFEGEAFFEVNKGKKFQVNSTLGTTQVLGTSFNIFSREKDYRVYCETGLVKVTHITSTKSVLLNPNQLAYIEKNTINSIEKANEEEQIAWRMGNFNFETISLEKVLQALEQEYNVKINSNFSSKSNYIYTGFFQKQENAFDALETVCLSLDLKVNKINEKEYSVLNAN